MFKQLITLIILSLLSFYSTESFAQSYIGMTDSTNQWNFTQNTSGPCPDCCQDFTYYFKGDTTIGAYTYRKLYKSAINYCFVLFVCDRDSICSISDEFIAGLRDDTSARRVYAYIPGIQTDTLLYDFDLRVGDTLGDTYFDIYKMNHNFIDWVVDSIGYESIGSNIHRVFYMDSVRNGPFSFYMASDFKIIEGIGSAYGLIYNTWYDKFYLHVSNRLQCFTNSSGVYPSGVSTCNFITSIDSQNKLASEDWNLYPNPTDGMIELTAVHSFVLARLYTIEGKKVMEQRLLEGRRNSLEIEGEPGVYYLQLEAEDGRISTAKVIKQ